MKLMKIRNHFEQKFWDFITDKKKRNEVIDLMNSCSKLAIHKLKGEILKKSD